MTPLSGRAESALLMQTLADEDNAPGAQEAATEELQGLPYALWR